MAGKRARDKSVSENRDNFGGHSQIFTTSEATPVCSPVLESVEKESTLHSSTSTRPAAPRYSREREEIWGDCREISKIVTGVCVGKSCVLRAKAMCMLVWLVPIRSGGREQRSVARYFPCC